MAQSFYIKIEDGKVNIFLNNMTTGILKAITGEIKNQSQLLGDFMKTRFLSGGSNSSLAVRTGLLRKSLKVEPTEQQGDSIVGGISVGEGVPYSRVHINRFGTETTITSSGKMMTIPIGPALTAAGASKKANAESYGRGAGGLFPFKSKSSGRVFLVKSVGKGKGSRLIPYFILTRSVKIKARVDPDAVLKLRERNIVEGLKQAITLGASLNE